jgi:hypothetical protein
MPFVLVISRWEIDLGIQLLSLGERLKPRRIKKAAKSLDGAAPPSEISWGTAKKTAANIAPFRLLA